MGRSERFSSETDLKSKATDTFTPQGLPVVWMQQRELVWEHIYKGLFFFFFTMFFTLLKHINERGRS